MNFDEAISAHSQWKSKLVAYIAKPDGTLEAGIVSLDNRCPLGQWIYGEGAQHSGLPEFTKLRTEHNRFHKIAGDVVRKAAAGQQVTEDLALGAHSDFAAASSSVVLAIMAMKAKMR